MSHGEGRFTSSPEALDRLLAQGRVAFQYADAEGRPTLAGPDNPNGSPQGVAGVCDPTGRLFGLMPHPDAYLYSFHHPLGRRRRRNGEGSEGAGVAIFRNGVDAAAARL